jgi:hypothetical protein
MTRTNVRRPDEIIWDFVNKLPPSRTGIEAAPDSCTWVYKTKDGKNHYGKLLDVQSSSKRDEESGEAIVMGDGEGADLERLKPIVTRSWKN